VAKISNGPLVATISGRLGPVVFAWTRFGQVVKSASKGKPLTTPAQIQNGYRFTLARKIWGAYRLGLFRASYVVADRAGRMPWGPFTSAYLNWMNGQPYDPPCHEVFAKLRIVESQQVGLKWRFRVDGNPTIYNLEMFGICISNDGVLPFENSGGVGWLTADGWSTLQGFVPTRDFDVIAVSHVSDWPAHPEFVAGGWFTFWHQTV